MRVFWALIGALVLLGGAYLALGYTRARTAETRAREAAEVAREQADLARTKAATMDELARKNRDADAKNQELAAQLDALKQTDSPDDATPGETAPSPAAPTSTETAAAPTTPTPEPGPTVVKKDTGEDLSSYEVVPATIVKNDDGSMLVDSRYVIKGDGTPEKPYEVTWELLISAEELFSPENKKKKLPERVMMLHGKYVTIGGYIAFPLMVKQPRELLAMLNQWDGCCIGVPPTPYDAIEVMLKQTVNPDLRYATEGSVTGRFMIKPYLVGDWLVGLYVMELGDLNATEFGGVAGN